MRDGRSPPRLPRRDCLRTGRVPEYPAMRLGMHGLVAVFIVCVLAATLGAEAQQTAKVARIGYLAGALAANPHFPEAFRQGLRDLGHDESRNILIEYRSAEGQLERLADLAVELVRLKVDVILSEGTPPTLAAKQATKAIPIVFAASADAVESGIVVSLARPGGNVTGLTFFGPELVGKHLQLLKQAVRGISRVAVLWQSGGPGALPGRTQRILLKEIEAAVRALAVQLQLVDTRGPGDFDRAFSEMTTARTDALTVLTSYMLFNERKHLAVLAAKNRLPAMYPWTDAAVAGAPPVT
jgi:putative ABC transport system substrate-binding protein